MMSILIELPEDLERSLRQQVENLDAAAKEVFLVNLYRDGKLGYGPLSQALGLSRMQVEALLKEHKVYYEITPEDVVRESETARKCRESDVDRR